MALPAAGNSISLQQVNVELGNTGTDAINMGSSAVRTLFDVSSGAIDMSDGFGKSATYDVEYMVVAGGGGAGNRRGGGGGGGGYRVSDAFALTPGTQYTVTVGAGGAGGAPGNQQSGLPGVKGSDSVFATITSTGGGLGGGLASEAQAPGGTGGSG